MLKHFIDINNTLDVKSMAVYAHIYIYIHTNKLTIMALFNKVGELIYIYIYIHTYIHTYIYIYIYRERERYREISLLNIHYRTAQFKHYLKLLSRKKTGTCWARHLFSRCRSRCLGSVISTASVCDRSAS